MDAFIMSGMKLLHYLKINKIRQNTFAKVLGISAPYLSQLCTESKVPTLSMALKIQRETGGKVCPEDFADAVKN